MKIFRLLLLTTTILLLNSNYSFAQKDLEFINEITKEQADLTGQQNAKYLKIKENKAFKEVLIIRVGNVRTLEKRGALHIKIPGLPGALVAHREALEVRGENEFQWTGRFRDDSGEVFINATNEGIFGRIIYEDDVYQLEGLGDGKSLFMKVNKEILTPEECGTIQPELKATKKNRQLKNHCAAVPIRVGVLFTQAAQNTGLNMNNIAQVAIADLNTSITSSGLTSHDVSFQVAGVQFLNGFVETANICNDAATLSNDNNAIQFRNDLNILADVVILLTDGPYGLAVGCANAIEANAAQAFGIVQAAQANAVFSFGHEVIHLIGGRHQQCALFFNPGCDDTPGFEHGWKYRTGWWPFRKEKTTIMHQQQNGWTRQREVSNPAVHGNANLNDNAQMLEDNACNVAAFMVNPMTVNITGPSVVEENSSGTWCFTVQNCNTIQNRLWEVSTDGWNYTFAGSGNCITRIITSEILHIRLTVTCTDGQVVTDFHIVFSSGGFELAQPKEEESLKSLSLETTLDLSSTEILTYPNPTLEDLNIVYNISKGTNTDIYLTDMMGRSQIIFNGTSQFSEQKTITLPVVQYSPGLYILTVIRDNSIHSKKIMIHGTKP